MPRIRAVVAQDEKYPLIGVILPRGIVSSFSAWLLTNQAVRPRVPPGAIPLFPPLR
jgi:hypothetical protein